MRRVLASSFSSSAPWAAVALLLPFALSDAGAAAAAPAPASPPASIWSAPAFSLPAAKLIAAARALPAATDQPVDYLLFETRLSLDADGLWTERQHQIYRVLDPTAVDDWAYVEVGWSPWHQLKPELAARVIGGDGTERKLDPKTISESSSGEDSAIMFDDGRVLRAPLPAVEAGAIVEIETVTRDQRPVFAAGSVRRVHFPNDRFRLARIDVDTAAGAPLRWARRLLPEVGPDEKTEAGRRRLHFEWRDLALDQEFVDGLPPEVPSYPYLAFSTGASWQSVAKSYSDVVDRAVADADVRAVVEQASAGATDQAQVIDRLLAYLQAQVRYTGIEFGDGGIIPRSPQETLARRFGDCKDKSVLLVALLRAADIPAYLALLSAGWGSDVEPDLPGLGNFNHAIVYVPASPPVWIDATEELARAGELPSSDRDRFALVAAPSTKSLQKTPPPAAADNLLTRTRTVELADLGHAKIVEENVYHGDLEIWARRNLGQSEEKARKEWLASYAKAYFLTDQIGPYTMEGERDLSQPFRTRLELPDSPRGSTDLNEAAVGIRLENLIERLPRVFVAEDPEGTEDETDEPELDETEEADATETPTADASKAGAAPEDAPKTARKQPYVFREPFVTQWRYEIQAPPGFAVRELPESKTEALGTATLERRYRTLTDGKLEAYFRFDSGKVRLSPAEFEAMREKTLALAQGEPILLYFDQVGSAALSQGKVATALDEYRGLAARYPDRGLYPLQVSRALLAGGLQEAAKVEAQRAVALSPKLAAAHQNLGWVLQHDPLGRLRGEGGFDRPGSIAAYRKAVALDPENDIAKADLAILLEYNDAGRQYGQGAGLEEAGKLYRELHDKGLTGVNVNLMNNLLERGALDELKQFAGKLEVSATRQQYLAAAVALKDGPDAASRLARSVADRDERARIIAFSAQQLVKKRRYPEAAKLFDILASLASNSAGLSAMQQLASVRRWEEAEVPERKPATLFARLLVLAFKKQLSPEELKDYLSRRLLPAELEDEAKAFQAKDLFENIAEKSGEAGEEVVQVGVDMIVHLLHSDVAGDDRLGYRVRSRVDGVPNGFSFTFFALLEDGKYRMLTDDKDWAPVGRLVLELAEAGQLDDARRWLDWAREETPETESADPYAKKPLARLWTAGVAGDLEAIRAAATVLLVTFGDGPLKPGERTVLASGLEKVAALRATASGETALAFDLATWKALAQLERWNDLAPILERLADAQPGSDRALSALAATYHDLGRASAILPRVQARLAQKPNDPTAVRMLADLADFQGDVPRSIQLTRELVDRGKSEPGDWNRLAWNQLFAPPVAEQALRDASRAAEMSDNGSRAILHTLASVYAELNRPTEAYRALVQSVEAGDKKADDSDWYVLGRIAETYGLPDQARAYYGRVEKPKEFLGVSAFTLAQRRLAGLPREVQAGKGAKGKGTKAKTPKGATPGSR